MLLEARSLGAPLEAGHQLHTDLQKMHLVTPDQWSSQEHAQDNHKPKGKHDEGHNNFDKDYLEKLKQTDIATHYDVVTPDANYSREKTFSGDDGNSSPTDYDAVTPDADYSEEKVWNNDDANCMPFL